MWCQWVKSYLIKGRNFWNLKIPGDCTWVWRKLLTLRPVVQPYILSILGNGQSTSLWYDNWHPLSPLMNKFGTRIAYDSGISKDATMSHIILNSNWAFPITQTWELNEVRNSLPPLIQSRLNGADHVRWTLTANGQFSIASLWDKLRTPFPKVMWHKLVWFSGHIPKCSFVTWIAILNRLSTTDRLLLFGLNVSPECSLCQEKESHDHLFFNCPYSQKVWGAIQTKLHVSWSPRSWFDWISFPSGVKGKTLKAVLTKLVFTVAVYHIWIERNVRKFQNLSCTWEAVVHKICSMVRARLLSLHRTPQSQAAWIENEWNLA
ncbi:uncharacterized protein LOC131330020 [Rhododendron vialii]|uniref:uncharacterized protein LOC131330020 n=1 Tax=Rhododendron vialii TaxID=182163 RepID=UPI00265DCAD0|nr:uncharacterized protein LOC131330020 [Rhododendron vialii]